MTQEKTSWWDDAIGSLGGVLDVVKDTASQYASGWLNDEFGTTSEPQKAVELPQAQNADVSNAPDVGFGFTQKQLLIGGGVLALGAVFLIAGRK